MRLNGVDLNLLVALKALIETGNVTQAAERLNLSQAAMSNALARLRTTFDDPLLVRVGRRMVLTDRARGLRDDLTEVLDTISSRILTAPDPCGIPQARRVSIMAPDAVASEFLPRALSHMASVAPGVTFAVREMNDAPIDHLEAGNIDLLAFPRQFASADHPQLDLHRDGYVILVSQTGRWRDGIGQEDYLDADHVVIEIGQGRKTPVDRAIIEQAHGPLRAGVSVYSQSHAPWYLHGTDLVATLPRRLAQQAAQHLPLVVHPVPFDIPDNHIVLQWNRNLSADQGLQWIVRTLAAAME